MNYVDKLNKIIGAFREKFNYDCEIPFEAMKGNNKEIDEFSKIVEKCVNDNFDYTIELYGTRPIPLGNPEDILID
ncbi:MAG: hypothetical protein ACI4HZ_04470 [Ruminococcus sp.]